jgi:DNA-binding CsgD family transcriptional regulator
MPHKLRWPEISRALARHDPSAVLTLLRERLPPGWAGDALHALTRTVPNWPQPQHEPTEPALTARELEVLRCAARGLTIEQTAREIILGVETVKTYRRQIAAKLGTRGIGEAVKVGRERGLIP